MEEVAVAILAAVPLSLLEAAAPVLPEYYDSHPDVAIALLLIVHFNSI